jgi:hypothetical protein
MTTELIRDTQPDAGPEPLDPALLQAIRPSARRMAAAEDAFVRLLHDEVEALVRQLPEGGWPFCERTARTVVWLALSDPPMEAVMRSLLWVGEANQADGFPESEYVSVGHALVRIAREVSGVKWTTTTGSAWIRFFMWLQPQLQADTRQAAARREAARQESLRQEAAYHETTAVDLLKDEVAEPPATRDEVIPGTTAPHVEEEATTSRRPPGADPV